MVRKFQLDWVEIEMAEACNLSCYGCSNYSDYEHSNWLSWQVGKNWLLLWTEKINFQNINLIGGEPLLNPELEEWLFGIRKLLPNTHLHISTNGTLIYKKKWIFDLMKDIGKCTLSISAHTPKHRDFLMGLREIIKYSNWNVNDNLWVLKGDLQYFLKTYKGELQSMKPYNSDPVNAYQICTQQNCTLIYKGNLYKCSSSAKLSMVLEDWGHIDDPDWKNFTNYRGLEPNSSPKQIKMFLDNVGQPNDVCKMCPEPKDYPFIKHRQNVWRKSEKRIIPITKLSNTL